MSDFTKAHVTPEMHIMGKPGRSASFVAMQIDEGPNDRVEGVLLNAPPPSPSLSSLSSASASLSQSPSISLSAPLAPLSSSSPSLILPTPPSETSLQLPPPLSIPMSPTQHYSEPVVSLFDTPPYYFISHFSSFSKPMNYSTGRAPQNSSIMSDQLAKTSLSCDASQNSLPFSVRTSYFPSSSSSVSRPSSQSLPQSSPSAPPASSPLSQSSSLRPSSRSSRSTSSLSSTSSVSREVEMPKSHSSLALAASSPPTSFQPCSMRLVPSRVVLRSNLKAHFSSSSCTCPAVATCPPTPPSTTSMTKFECSQGPMYTLSPSPRSKQLLCTTAPKIPGVLSAAVYAETSKVRLLSIKKRDGKIKLTMRDSTFLLPIFIFLLTAWIYPLSFRKINDVSSPQLFLLDNGMRPYHGKYSDYGTHSHHGVRPYHHRNHGNLFPAIFCSAIATNSISSRLASSSQRSTSAVVNDNYGFRVSSPDKLNFSFTLPGLSRTRDSSAFVALAPPTHSPFLTSTKPKSRATSLSIISSAIAKSHSSPSLHTSSSFISSSSSCPSSSSHNLQHRTDLRPIADIGNVLSSPTNRRHSAIFPIKRSNVSPAKPPSSSSSPISSLLSTSSSSPSSTATSPQSTPEKREIGCRAIGVGASAPSHVLTNYDLEKIMDTSHEWIYTRTGISKRHVLRPEENLIDYSIDAVKKALKDANMKSSDVDMLIYATSSPSDLFGDATAISHAIGAKNAVGWDLTAACSGFLFAMATASQFISSGKFKNVVVVGADALTRWLDWTDRNTSILFGDGVGAVVFTADDGSCAGIGRGMKGEFSMPSSGAGSNERLGLLSWRLRSDGTKRSQLCLPFSTSHSSERQCHFAGQQDIEEGTGRKGEGAKGKGSVGDDIFNVSSFLEYHTKLAENRDLPTSTQDQQSASSSSTSPSSPGDSNESFAFEGTKNCFLGGGYSPLSMNGREVFRFATTEVPAIIEVVVADANMTISDIDWLLLHQANIRIMDSVAEKLGIPREKILSNLEEYGNTSAASIPLCLDQAVRNGKVKKGDVIALAGFGAGLSWGGAVLRWG